MANSTGETERNKSVQALLRQGFHLTFSNDVMTVLSKPASHSTMYIAQVTDDGHVNTLPLSEFITSILDGNTN